MATKGKPKVLLLTQVLPHPPDSGPKVKTWNVLKCLVQDYDITLASFVRGDQSAEVVRLQQYCRAVHVVPMHRGKIQDGLAMGRSLLSGQPWMMVRDDRAEMRRLIDRLVALKSFSVVHADQLNMAQYATRVPGAFKLLDAHNALWLLYRRLATTMRSGFRKSLLERDWRLLKRYEGEMVRRFDAVLAVTDVDKKALLEAAAVDREITVIPIAVDVDELQLVATKTDANHILHMGTMYWPPNIDGVMWFIQDVLPIIRQGRPDVVFDVVGSQPPSALQELSKKDTGINVTGYVADPTSLLEQARVFVVPVRVGGGMRVKILNALARGLPIVSTTVGAEGIAVTPERDILLADEAASFAAAVLRLLNEPTLAARLRRNGRGLVEQLYDYRRACRLLSGPYQRAVGNDTYLHA